MAFIYLLVIELKSQRILNLIIKRNGKLSFFKQFVQKLDEKLLKTLNLNQRSIWLVAKVNNSSQTEVGTRYKWMHKNLLMLHYNWIKIRSTDFIEVQWQKMINSSHDSVHDSIIKRRNWNGDKKYLFSNSRNPEKKFKLNRVPLDIVAGDIGISDVNATQCCHFDIDEVQAQQKTKCAGRDAHTHTRPPQQSELGDDDDVSLTANSNTRADGHMYRRRRAHIME